MSDFHKRLLLMIDEIGLSMPQLASQIGVHQSTIRDRWIHDGSYPGADKIISLLTLSKRSANWLLTGDETEDQPYIHPDALELCDDINAIFESGNKLSQETLRFVVRNLQNRLLVERENEDLRKRIQLLEKAEKSPFHGRGTARTGPKKSPRKKKAAAK